MRLFRRPSFLLLRSLVRELTQIRQLLAIQTQQLVRLADHVAPIAPTTDPQIVAAETGVSYTDPTDQALLQTYAERIYRDTGHLPTDDELLSYLADEKTRDLHTRLVDREREIDRLGREGR